MISPGLHWVCFVPCPPPPPHPPQNDRWLTPDHGFPVRMIIPGFIGGRMVKFLEEITVTEKESDNFYHFHDNRVMPPHVDEELAKKEGEHA